MGLIKSNMAASIVGFVLATSSALYGFFMCALLANAADTPGWLVVLTIVAAIAGVIIGLYIGIRARKTAIRYIEIIREAAEEARQAKHAVSDVPTIDE